MGIRVTGRSLSNTVMVGLHANKQKMQELQRQLSTGKVMANPSDDSSAALSAMRFRAELARQKQYLRNAEDGQNWLGTADLALTSALSVLGRARELVLQGLNTGVNTSVERNAISAEISTIKEMLVSLANTAYLGKPIFAGTSSSTEAYGPDGDYLGNNEAITRSVSRGIHVQVSLDGPGIFGEEEQSLFVILDKIVADLHGNESALLEDLDALDAKKNNMLNALGLIGARFNRIDKLSKNTESKKDTVQKMLSEVEDIDLAEIVMALRSQEAAYQAALAASAKVIQPSLVDFIR